ncbi:MAG: sulfide/dihydroorotate dehydrogenase-like FAD/NAD-binding protein [Oscillospiraceae bacterium]|nr:sulfide/dihydroorotate dehydrogenase-like FAD/NAD-binding protein [Oscillospiraceae bacterium]
MYRIVTKKVLTPTLVLIEIEAPMIAKKAEPGQFIILRVDENGERIPITIHDFNREKGTVSIIYQVVGATTEKLFHKEEGDCIQDFVGPLGNATEMPGCKKVAVVGGGVGTAIAFPVAKKLHESGVHVDLIVGFRNKDVVVLEDEFKKACTNYYVGTDDGSYVRKALVTELLEEQINAGANYDAVFCVGPMMMMKFVCKVTEKYNIPTVVSMSPIMVDGTGMCGCCRLTLKEADGTSVTKFACVDGPDFDGFKVDWDESVKRGKMYGEWERHKHEETCNLFKKEVK